MKRVGTIGFFVGVIAIIVVAVFLLTRSNQSNQMAAVADAPLLAVPALIDTDSVDTKKFEHPTYGFSLHIPTGMHIERYDEGQDSETIVFTDFENGREFQVFITPYDLMEITPGRLAMDIPSGDVREPVNIVLGSNTRAVMFLTNHALLGETREVWFISDGYLYEVTTVIDLDTWIAEILSTLQFR